MFIRDNGEVVLDSEIFDAAMAALPTSCGRATATVDGVTFEFERSGRWSDTEKRVVPNAYYTAWVTRGWPGFEVAKKWYHDGTWATKIHHALGVPLKQAYVRMGYDSDMFDVREF